MPPQLYIHTSFQHQHYFVGRKEGRRKVQRKMRNDAVLEEASPQLGCGPLSFRKWWHIGPLRSCFWSSIVIAITHKSLFDCPYVNTLGLRISRSLRRPSTFNLTAYGNARLSNHSDFFPGRNPRRKWKKRCQKATPQKWQSRPKYTTNRQTDTQTKFHKLDASSEYVLVDVLCTLSWKKSLRSSTERKRRRRKRIYT